MDCANTREFKIKTLIIISMGCNENLSLAYLGTGNIRQSLKYKKICERFRPNYFINHSDKGLFSLYYDRNIDNAHKEFSRALELNYDFPFEFCYLNGGFVDWMHDDFNSAEIKFSNFISARIDQLLPMSQISGRWYVAHFFLFEDRFNKAIQVLEKNVTLAKQHPMSKLLPWAQLELAVAFEEIGQTLSAGSPDTLESIRIPCSCL